MTSAVIGVANPVQLENNLKIIQRIDLTSEEEAILQRLLETRLYQAEAERKRYDFFKDTIV